MKGGFLSIEARGASCKPPIGMNGNMGQQVQQVSQKPFGQPAPIPDLGAIKEAMHELYGLGLN